MTTDWSRTCHIPVHPTVPSRMESGLYYAGLPSRPQLIARSSALQKPWHPSIGPGRWTVKSELMVVGDHTLNNGVWEDRLAPRFLAILEDGEVQWTSVDVVRIRTLDEEERLSDGRVIIWIGVMPGSLTSANGYDVVIKCKKFLEQEGINDVHVELRESTVNYLAGPKFHKPTSCDAAAEACMPLTSTLGLSISAKSTLWVEGTGGFFMAEGGDSERIFLVTARHAVLPPDIVDNDALDECTLSTQQPDRHVLLLGDSAYKRLHHSVQKGISRAHVDLDHGRITLEKASKKEESARESRWAKTKMYVAEEILQTLKTFDEKVLPSWFTHNDRVLGHIIFSPPISMGVGKKRYLEDFAIIQMDTSKFDNKNFAGNAVDFGEEAAMKFRHYMETERSFTDKDFIYPFSRLVYLQGTVSVQELHHPTIRDRHGKPNRMVFKRGCATGLTFGYANNIPSFTRYYFNNKFSETSMEWPVLPIKTDYRTPSFGETSSTFFSGEGDSGAIIVNGHGQMVSLLTGGAGTAEFLDLTYGTHIECLLESITKRFPHAHLYPVCPQIRFLVRRGGGVEVADPW